MQVCIAILEFGLFFIENERKSTRWDINDGGGTEKPKE